MGPYCSSLATSSPPTGPNFWINLPDDLYYIIYEYLDVKELVKLMRCNRSLRMVTSCYIRDETAKCDEFFHRDENVIDMNRMDFAWKGDSRYVTAVHKFYNRIALWWFEFNGAFTISKKGHYYLLFYSTYTDYTVRMSLNGVDVIDEDILPIRMNIGSIPMILHSCRSNPGELKI